MLLAIWAAAGFLAMLALGLWPVLPWSFLAALIAAPPEAWAIAGVLSWASNRSCPWWLAVCAGLALLLAEVSGVTSGPAGQAILIAIFLLRLLLVKQIPSRHLTALLGLIAIMAGNLAVLAWNYVVMVAARDRIADATAQVVDAQVYRALGRTSYHAIFPLAHGWTFSLIERAYIFLFLEIVVVLFLLAPNTERMTRYLQCLFACNVMAFLVFLLWPVAGPYLIYPDSIDSATARGTVMEMLAVGGLREFRTMLAGGQPASGYGVFIGFPSLHVAFACLFQWWIRHRAAAWWALLPINVLLVVGTVVLGQHYLIDVPAGIVLAWFAIALLN